MIRNAKITSTFLGREDHGIPTCSIMLDYGGMAQSYGGYDLRFHGINMLIGIMETIGAGSWEKMPGMMVRVEQEQSRVSRIGHIIEDKWYQAPTVRQSDTQELGA